MKKLLAVVLFMLVGLSWAGSYAPPSWPVGTPTYDIPIKINGYSNFVLWEETTAIVTPVGTVTPTATPVPTLTEAQYLPHFRAAYQKMIAGTGRCSIMFLGDSTTMGYGAAVTGDGYQGSRPFSYPSYTGQLLVNASVPSYDSAWISHNGTNDVTVDAAYDTRISFGSGWSFSGGFNCLGGNNAVNSTNANPIVFSPTQNETSFEVVYTKNTTYGSFSAKIDSGTPVTINENASTAVGAVTLSTTSGTHTLSVARVSGTVSILAIRSFNTTVPHIEILNPGIYGSYAGGWQDASTVYSTVPSITNYWKPDLSIINLVINDTVGHTDLGNYKMYLQTLITGIQGGGGDSILTTSTPIDGAYGDMTACINVVKQLALENGILLIDTHSRFEDYMTANALGFMSDSFHLNKFGYRDEACMLVSDAILKAIR